MIACRPVFRIDAPPVQDAHAALVHRAFGRGADGGCLQVVACLMCWRARCYLLLMDQPLTQELCCGDRVRSYAIVLADELRVHLLS